MGQIGLNSRTTRFKGGEMPASPAHISPQISMHSPVGDLTVFEHDGRIVALDWGWGAIQQASPLLNKAITQLNEYFNGHLKAFNLPLNPHGTPHQKSVWAHMQKIPYGQTTTYGEIAAEISSSAQAVGSACGHNPIPIIIPCHRVVGTGVNIGGYSGEGGTETKINLLRLEGALLS